METTNNKTSVASEGKNIAIISYITIIGLIIAFVMNNDKKDAFASYHIKQSLVPFLGDKFVEWFKNI